MGKREKPQPVSWKSQLSQDTGWVFSLFPIDIVVLYYTLLVKAFRRAHRTPRQINMQINQKSTQRAHPHQPSLLPGCRTRTHRRQRGQLIPSSRRVDRASCASRPFAARLSTQWLQSLCPHCRTTVLSVADGSGGDGDGGDSNEEEDDEDKEVDGGGGSDALVVIISVGISDKDGSAGKKSMQIGLMKQNGSIR